MKDTSSRSISSALNSGIADFIEIVESKTEILEQATKVREGVRKDAKEFYNPEI